MQQENPWPVIGGSFVGLVLLCVAIAFGMWGCPQYNVWEREMGGKAELAQATYNRQIKIQEANATKEAANALAEAEVIRAKGVAQANEIIGESLKDNAGYLQYLWIQGMQTNQMQVVYVPTESNLPILEANRWNHTVK